MACKAFKKIVVISSILFIGTGTFNGYGQGIERTSSPLKKVMNFMSWYKKNKENITVRLLKGGNKDSVHFYRINYDSLNVYLKWLNESNFFSTNFINSLYNYAIICDSNFTKYPQTDFIAQGFEFDIVTKLMDDVDLFDNIEHFKKVYKKKVKLKQLSS